MSMLHTLRPAPGSRKKLKRVARGSSAGGGTTAGRGTKGQHSRAGSKHRIRSEGGQVPLMMRQPKLGGFNNPRREEYEVLNLDTLEEKLEAGSYDVPTLRKLKLLRTKKSVKLLSRGAVKKKFSLSVHAASKSAKEAIEKAGGKVEIVS